MKPSFLAAILLIVGASLYAQEHPSHPSSAKSTELHLTATVAAVVPLTEFSGQVIPTDFAPSFAMTVRIGTVSPVVNELAPGTEVTFAIHSPAELFEGDPDKNSVYDFYLVRETKDGKVRFNGLSTHNACAEDDVIGSPLKGWVGYTNTGVSVADMTVTAHTTPKGPAVATAMTDSTGRFFFPTLGPGKYYLKATKKLVDAIVTADDFVTVRKGKELIACLVAEAEETKETSPQ